MFETTDVILLVCQNICYSIDSCDNCVKFIEDNGNNNFKFINSKMKWNIVW